MSKLLPELIDITDVQFEHCVALRYVCGGKQGAKFLCRCECGKEFVARSVDIRKGRVKSCGCVNRRELINKNTKMVMLLCITIFFVFLF